MDQITCSGYLLLSCTLLYATFFTMGDEEEEFAYRTDRPVDELRQELEDLAAGWTVRHHPTPPHPAHPSGPPGWPADPAAAATAPHTPDNSGAGAQLAEGTTFTAVDAGGTPCEWIKTDCKAETKLDDAVYFHMHGGGHYRGSSRVAAPVCSHLSSLAGVDCLSVNYRVAPEHKWPVAVDDCYAAYTWLVESGVAPEKIIIGGDSAGGDLAFSLLLKLRDEAPELLPAGAIGLSPWTDLTQSGGTFVTNADSGVSNCVRSAIR